VIGSDDKIRGSLADMREYVALIEDAFKNGRLSSVVSECHLLHLEAERLKVMAMHRLDIERRSEKNSDFRG